MTSKEAVSKTTEMVSHSTPISVALMLVFIAAAFWLGQLSERQSAAKYQIEAWKEDQAQRDSDQDRLIEKLSDIVTQLAIIAEANKQKDDS